MLSGCDVVKCALKLKPCKLYNKYKWSLQHR